MFSKSLGAASLTLICAFVISGCTGEQPANKDATETAATSDAETSEAPATGDEDGLSIGDAEASPSEVPEPSREAVSIEWQQYAFEVLGYQMTASCVPETRGECLGITVAYDDPSAISMTDFDNATAQSPIILKDGSGTVYTHGSIQGIRIGDDGVELASRFILQYLGVSEPADSCEIFFGDVVIPLSTLPEFDQ